MYNSLNKEVIEALLPNKEVVEGNAAEWINVKDDLPTKTGLYWVCYEIDGRLKSHYCLWERKSKNYKGNKYGWRSREIIRKTNIRFWTKIPSPPNIEFIIN